LFSYKELWAVLGVGDNKATVDKDMNIKIRDLKNAMKLNRKDRKIFICNRGYVLK